MSLLLLYVIPTLFPDKLAAIVWKVAEECIYKATMFYVKLGISLKLKDGSLKFKSLLPFSSDGFYN